LGAPSCPSPSTTLDYAASTIVIPSGSDVTLINQLDSTGSIMVLLPYIDPTGNGDYEERTMTYDFVCEPVPA
jgi:hypothetical protein